MLSLRIRRVIYLTFIALFVITAPLLVLYSAGYRYNTRRGLIQKIGSLSVKPFPTTAEVRLDDTLVNGSRSDSTARIQNLVPGEYKVTVALLGYYPWEKKLIVDSNTNTFVDHVVLFRNNQPALLQAGATQVVPAPDHNTLAVFNDKTLSLITATTGVVTATVPLTQTLSQLTWSSDANAFVAYGTATRQWYWYSLAALNRPVSPTAILPSAPQTVRWSTELPYIIYARAGRELWQYNTITRVNKRLAILPETAATSSDVLVLDTLITYAHRTTDGSFIEQIKTTDTTPQPQRLLALAGGTDVTFSVIANNVVLITDQKRQITTAVDRNFQSVLFEVPGTQISWDSTSQHLLSWTDFELWLTDVSQNKSELITRYGQPIIGGQIIPNIAYAAITTGTDVSIIEFDNRDSRNTISLFTGTNLHNLNISPDGNWLTVVGTTDIGTGLLRQQIQSR